MSIDDHKGNDRAKEVIFHQRNQSINQASVLVMNEEKNPQNMNHLQASASSSPAHEFSFLISLPQTATSNSSSTAVAAPLPPKAMGLVDLSPADDIFFHGHLLPLHLLSHLPSSNISPRSSTNSLESFTLPTKEDPPANNSSNRRTTEIRSEETPKPKNSFSLLKWRKDNKEEETKDSSQKSQKKRRFDLSHVLKRYIRMVRPIFISLRRRSENGLQLRGRRQSYSFSGSLTPRGRGSGGGGSGSGGGRRRGLFSAPASLRTSPTNSGLLVATGSSRGASSTSDSTMEEIQAAIQAAIAHCKNSIAVDDNGHSNNKVINC